MVKIIGITGGKGGTGKSTIATSLSLELSKKHKVLLIDADADCPNDHLILKTKLKTIKTINQFLPKIKNKHPEECRECSKVCSSHALLCINNELIFIEHQCNGCKACYFKCKENIKESYKKQGEIKKGKHKNLHLLTGIIDIGIEESSAIVRKLIDYALSLKSQYDYIIIDTAAGTHCNVISALWHTKEVIFITEPTPLGLHDLKLIHELSEILNKTSYLVINKYDLGNKEILKKIESVNIPVITKIPFSKNISKAYSSGSIEYSELNNYISEITEFLEKR